MRYLKSFNESIQSKEDIILTIKDILLEFVDNYYPVSVYEKTGAIVIEIGEESKQMIKLHEYELVFKHLFYYLDDMGYKIETNISYVTNDTWDYRILCPKCGSDRIIINDNIGQCEKCDLNDDLYKFNMDDAYPASQSDLEYFIKNKYWIQFMYLYLKKD
jgi:Zn finger protein HypA/HybF involved in hydrogenase expression